MNVFGLILIPDWIIYATVALYAVYKYLTWHFGYWKSQNIKFCRPIPIFGSLWTNLFETIHSTDKKACEKFGKVWGIYEIRKPCLLVADAQLIKTISVSDFHQFTNRRWFPLTMKNRLVRLLLPIMEGNEWHLTKSKLSATFASKKLNQMTSLFEESISGMIGSLSKAIETNSNVNVQSHFEALTMDVISKSCFGRIINPDAIDDEFVAQANKLYKATNSFKMLLGSICPKLMETLEIEILPESCFIYFRKALTQVIGMRKQDKIRRNDFLQLLLNSCESRNDNKTAVSDDKEDAKDNAGEDTATSDINPFFMLDKSKEKRALDEDVLVANIILFIMDGYDTIANTLSFATYLLALNQKCQDKLCEEIDKAAKDHGKLHYDVIMSLPYLEAVVSETLRLFPPVVRFERRCNSNYCLNNNILIRKNMLVIVPIYAIHHNEDYFPSPETFDPERFSPENKAKHNREWTFMPFGVGPRSCIGMKFAIMDIKMALAYFFQHFRVSVSRDTEIPLRMKRGSNRMKPLNGVHLMVEERK